MRAARARGKHLLVEFDSGHVLRTHLRMHGTVRVRDGSHLGPIASPHEKYPHVGGPSRKRP